MRGCPKHSKSYPHIIAVTSLLTVLSLPAAAQDNVPPQQTPTPPSTDGRPIPVDEAVKNDLEKEILKAQVKSLSDRLEALERHLVAKDQAERKRRRQQVRQANVQPPPPVKPKPTGPETQPPVTESPVAANERSDIPQEAFLFRESAVTLAPGRIEAAFDIIYQRNRAQLTLDRAVQGTASVRVGVFDGLEMGVVVPYYASERTFPRSGISDSYLTSLGDITAQLNMRLWQETANIPGAVFSLSGTIPTGTHPYVAMTQAELDEGRIPLNPLSNYVSSRGHYALRGNLQFYKTVDPLNVFAGVGFEHSFARDYYNLAMQPGNRYFFNMGFGFALSERSTLGMAFNWSLTENLKVNGREIRDTSSEQGSVRFTLIQRVGESSYIEPSVSIGVIEDAPDFTIGLNFKHRL